MTDVPLGKHVLEVRIAEVIEETADSRSLVFEIPDRAADKFAYAPGQYLTLRIPSDRTGSVARCYSLSSSPHLDDRLAVTVKRTADGYGSNWICDNAHAGMHMHVLAPSGVFVPKQLDNDFLLLAGGSGVTPMMAICKSALSQGSGKVVLIYANRDEQSVIFGAALRELAAKYPDRLTVIHWLESVQGLPSQQQLATLTAPFAEHEAFICGPGPFMDASEAALKGNGMPHDRVHIEVFRSWKATRSQRSCSPSPRTTTNHRRPRPWNWTGRPTRSVGHAAPCYSTCYSPRAWTRRSPAVKATA